MNLDIPLKPLLSKPMKLSEITPNAKNPRLIKEERFKKLVRSLENLPDFTAIRAIILDEDKKIIGGNMRFRAMQHLKWKWAIVQVYDREYHAETEAALELGKSYEDVCREMVIRDNVSFGQDDFDILANEYDPLELDEWGLDVWQPEEEEKEGLTDPDEVPEAPEEPKTKLGDLYILGDHRLLCGDSTKAEDVEKLMNGEKADALITDPPYGIDLDTDYSKMGKTTTKYEKIKGDESEFDLREVIRLSGAKEQYVWGGDYFTNSIDWMKGTPIVWAKRHSEQENKVFGSAFEILWTNQKCKKAIWFIRPINQSSERLGKHPTQKPIECMTRCIDMTKLSGVIYDAFLGSGSTLIAAEKTNRKCYGMELDPKYCDVIVKRWEDFTGKKAELWKQ